MKKKHIAVGLALIVIWGGAIGLLAYKSKDKRIKENQAIKRYIIPENKKTFFSGVVEPSKSKVFYKDISKGSNYKINKKNGETVSKGSLLITYKNEEIENQISDLEEQISELKKEKNKSSEFKNNEIQDNTDITTESVPLSIEDQIKNNKKQIEKLKKKEYIHEYAPFAGKVSIPSKAVDGENQVLLKLKSNDLYVKAQVSERDLEKAKLNQDVEVLVLANDKNIKGQIIDISYDPEEQSISTESVETSQVANYPVIISLDSKENVVNGYHVQVKLKDSEKLIEIPSTAIKTEGNKKYVYLIKDNKLVKQDIKIKGEKGKLTKVSSGLKEKDEIVESINSEMKEGQEIE